MKKIIRWYQSQVKWDSTKSKEDQTKEIFVQLKALRDERCKRAKNLNDILRYEYAYICAALNLRNRVWEYNLMDFSRRMGEFWESFCKAAFRNAESDLRIYSPPKFKTVQQDLKLPKKLMPLIGEVNLRQDVSFYHDRRLHVIDLKGSLNSNEKGHLERLLRVGVVYRLWRPRSKRLILVREPDDNNHYLQKLNACWEVYAGDKAYDKIKEITKVDLKSWVDKHVDFYNHLDRRILTVVRDQKLEKYLKW
jgi:hypothetical protein